MFLTFNAFNTVNGGNLPEDIINNNEPARQNVIDRLERRIEQLLFRNPFTRLYQMRTDFRWEINQLRQHQNRMRLIANPNEADHNYQINTITDQRQVDFEHYLQLADKLVKSIPLDHPPVNALNVLVSAFNQSGTFIPNVSTNLHLVRPFFIVSVSLIDNSITDESVDIIVGGLQDTFITFKSIADAIADNEPHRFIEKHVSPNPD